MMNNLSELVEKLENDKSRCVECFKHLNDSEGADSLLRIIDDTENILDILSSECDFEKATENIIKPLELLLEYIKNKDVKAITDMLEQKEFLQFKQYNGGSV